MISKIQSQALKLIKILGLTRYQNENDLSFIQTSQFYYQIFSILFPSQEFLKENNGVNYFMLESDSQQIQFLIEYLMRILGSDLEEIDGAQVSRGNIVHIKKLLDVLILIAEDISQVSVTPVKSAKKQIDLILDNSNILPSDKKSC
jgi:hypothetical protein